MDLSDQSAADRVILSVGIGGPGSDNMTNPTKCAAAADPETGGNNQPENAGKDAAIVELAYSGKNKTQNTRQIWIAHLLVYLRGKTIRRQSRLCSPPRREKLQEITTRCLSAAHQLSHRETSLASAEQ